MKKTWIIIATISIIIIVTAISIFISTQSLDINFKPAFTKNAEKGRSILNDYDAKVTKFDSRSAISFKNIVASTADTTPKHFKIDILIVTQNKDVAKMFKKQHQLTVLLITNALSSFKGSDVNSLSGKKFLKDTIKREIERKYGAGTVTDIYFENFIRS